jgi:hypothetical protein
MERLSANGINQDRRKNNYGNKEGQHVAAKFVSYGNGKNRNKRYSRKCSFVREAAFSVDKHRCNDPWNENDG